MFSLFVFFSKLIYVRNCIYFHIPLLFSVNALKVRWKSLRDAYVKERKYEMSNRSHSTMKKKKPWRLKTYMDFLAPYIHNRKDLSTDEWTEKNDITFPHEIRVEETVPVNKSNIINKKKSDLSSQKKVNVLSQAKVNVKQDRVLEMDSFFRGIADAVKSLNPKNQLLVQKEVTNLVMNYKLQELEEDVNIQHYS